MTSHSSSIACFRQSAMDRVNEKRDIQELNDQFNIYIQRVKDLDDKNRQLRMQIDSLTKNWDSDSIKMKQQYDKDLISLRDQLNITTSNTQKAQIQLMRAEYDKGFIGEKIFCTDKLIADEKKRILFSTQELERTKSELDTLQRHIGEKKQDIERSKNEIAQQLERLGILNKELHCKSEIRVVFEVELQTLREVLAFTKAVCEEEIDEISSLSQSPIDVGQFYHNELDRAISSIKHDFQLLACERYQEWEEYYKVKLQHIQAEMAEQKLRQIEANLSDNVQIMDTETVKSALSKYYSDYSKLKSKSLNLNNQLEALKDECEATRLNQKQSQSSFEQENNLLLEKFNEYKVAIANIHENNVSLKLEINTYRRLLEGAIPAPTTKTHEIAIVWSNSPTADFSISDSKKVSILHWAESVKVAAPVITLPTAFMGPKGCNNVSFTTVYYSSNERVVVEANIADQFNMNNYGIYQVTIFYPNSKTAIGSWPVYIEPKNDICMPKQVIIRDSVNNIITDTTVQLMLDGQTIFTGTSNGVGIVNLPTNLPENCYDISINTHQARYKTGNLKKIVFQSKGANSITFFIYRQMQVDELEFLLTWGKRPTDLDSHLYVSDGRHVFFSRKQERNVSLDYDCREGGGPETIKVKLEPNMKYVYAVHRYSKDGELAQSNATVTISTNEVSASTLPIQVICVPYVDQPEANFWIVCQIDGSTKKIKIFDQKFENQDECTSDSFIRQFYDV